MAGSIARKRGRADRRRHQRRAAGRARRGKADLHAGATLPIGRPDHRRGRRQGALRAERHQRGPGGRRRRRGDGDADAGGFVLEKFGGDTVTTSGPASRTTGSGSPDAPRPGRRQARAGRRVARGGAVADHGLTGTDEAGSGGDGWAGDGRRPGRAPGSGKSVVGRRLANRHGAAPGRPRRADRERGRWRHLGGLRGGRRGGIPGARSEAAIVDLGPADPAADIRRVISTGGGAVVDPRNRWALYRGRTTVWLDGRPEVLAQRLRRSPNVRPLVTGRDPIGTLRDLAARRERFYAATDIHTVGRRRGPGVVDAVEAQLRSGRAGRAGTTLLPDPTPIGRFVLGDGIAAATRWPASSEDMRTRRARILVTEPGAWGSRGGAAGRRASGSAVARSCTFLLPEGEAAKRLEVVEGAARELARSPGPGRGTAGRHRGRRARRHGRLPRSGLTCVAVRIDPVPARAGGPGGTRRSAGGEAVEVAEGKNLVGAFHQPSAIIIDTAMLRDAPRATDAGRARRGGQDGGARRRAVVRAARGRRGASIARGAMQRPSQRGSSPRLVEQGGLGRVRGRPCRRTRAVPLRPAASLSQPRALPRARIRGCCGGSTALLHGEAVAYGLRAACRIGEAVGVTPPERSARIGCRPRRPGARGRPAPLRSRRRARTPGARQEARGRQTPLGVADQGRVEIRSDVPDEVVVEAAGSLLAAGSAS